MEHSRSENWPLPPLPLHQMPKIGEKRDPGDATLIRHPPEHNHTTTWQDHDHPNGRRGYQPSSALHPKNWRNTFIFTVVACVLSAASTVVALALMVKYTQHGNVYDNALLLAWFSTSVGVSLLLLCLTAALWFNKPTLAGTRPSEINEEELGNVRAKRGSLAPESLMRSLPQIPTQPIQKQQRRPHGLEITVPPPATTWLLAVRGRGRAGKPPARKSIVNATNLPHTPPRTPPHRIVKVPSYPETTPPAPSQKRRSRPSGTGISPPKRILDYGLPAINAPRCSASTETTQPPYLAAFFSATARSNTAGPSHQHVLGRSGSVDSAQLHLARSQSKTQTAETLSLRSVGKPKVVKIRNCHSRHVSTTASSLHSPLSSESLSAASTNSNVSAIGKSLEPDISTRQSRMDSKLSPVLASPFLDREVVAYRTNNMAMKRASFKHWLSQRVQSRAVEHQASQAQEKIARSDSLRKIREATLRRTNSRRGGGGDGGGDGGVAVHEDGESAIGRAATHDGVEHRPDSSGWGAENRRPRETWMRSDSEGSVAGLENARPYSGT